MTTRRQRPGKPRRGRPVPAARPAPTRSKPPSGGERGERLQKVLSRAGLGSRREIDGWIAEGRVEVNGEVAVLGRRVGASDRVVVDGKEVAAATLKPGPDRVVLLYKPAGVVCSRVGGEGLPTVFDYLPQATRWVSVGRLDINTQGLLLFTTNGDLAHRLMHPSSRIKRVYAARLDGSLEREDIDALRHGVELEDGTAAFESVIEAGGVGRNRWYHVALREGRYREVRRVFEARGFRVGRLIRVQFGPIHLPRAMKAGEAIELVAADRAALKAAVSDVPSEPGRSAATVD